MKKLRVNAKVYDTTTMEYVQRWAEIEISDEIATAINQARSKDGICSIHASGHGDSKDSLSLSTPLRNQQRFRIDPQLIIIDNDENGEEVIVGGWQGM